MRKTPLRKISKKQRGKQAVWDSVTDQKAQDLNYICEWCGKKGHRDKDRKNDWFYLWGHHKKKRSLGREDTYENCYLIHYLCHSFVEQKGIDVNKYPSRKEWLENG